MSVVIHTFNTPIPVDDPYKFDTETALLFSKSTREEIPAGMVRDLTVAGSVNPTRLHTYARQLHGQEDTIGEVRMFARQTHTVGQPEGGTVTESERLERTCLVDEEHPSTLIASLHKGKWLVYRIVRYVPPGSPRAHYIDATTSVQLAQSA